jgi:hypothetical protein
MSEKIELDKPVQNAYGWYVGVKDDDYNYLNDDGIIQDGVSRYFATEAEALEAIAKFEKANAEATQ